MNEIQKWTLAKGYRFLSNEEGLPPVYVNRPDNEETFDLRDRNFAIIDGCFGFMLSQVLEHMIQTRRPPIDVLDIGGGTLSLAAKKIAQDHPDTTRVTNIDVVTPTNSKDMQNFRNLCEDACNMSIPDNSIDLIYSYQMMYGLNKHRKQQMLGQIARVLKPEGIALIDEYDLCGLSSSDPQLEQLSNSLSLSVILRKGNVTKICIIDKKYVNTNQFLMLMKPPIDLNIAAMTERKTA